ncbi:MAG: hypothetical protein ACYDBP_11545 [Leptospirales bacterium]
MTRTINLVIPDAGPLISLAKGGHLDLLLLFKPDVRILIADAVVHPVSTRRKPRPLGREGMRVFLDKQLL